MNYPYHYGHLSFWQHYWSILCVITWPWKFPLCTRIFLSIIVISNFVNQLVFAISICAEEIVAHLVLRSCIYLKILYFFQVLGELSTVLGLMALTILQYKKLTSSEINNTMLRCNSSKPQHIIFYHLAYVWGISIILSFIPILINHKLVLTIPSLAAGIAIIIYIATMFKLHKNINARHVIRHTIYGNITLVRSLRFLKGSGVLLILTWIPPFIALLFWLLFKNQNSRAMNSGISQVGLSKI